VTSVAFSPDSKHIVTGSYDNTARIWDVTTGKEIKTLRGHEGYIWSVAFSPDGKRIVSASYDHTARVWDVNTGEEIFILSGHTDEIWSASFSPDGKHIVTASNDQTARIWNAAFKSTGELADYALSVVPRCLNNEQRQTFFLDPERLAESDPLYCRKWQHQSGLR
jgi:WD40 repeat protein